MKYHLFLFIFICIITSCKNSNSYKTEVCIYGGNSGGIIAGVSLKRLNVKSIIIEPSTHLGGLTTGGLGGTDIGQRAVCTGITSEFYQRIGKKYNKFYEVFFAPSVASAVFNDFIKESELDIRLNYYVVKVIKKENKITRVAFLNSTNKDTLWVEAKIFIDCSYEGDLMAKSGVSYTLGRENNKQYNEKLNGFQLLDEHQFPDGIDPFIIKGDSTSGLLSYIGKGSIVEAGSGDSLLQAYNYRMCWTKDTTNMISFLDTKPNNYDPKKYELVARLIEKQVSLNMPLKLTEYFWLVHFPDGKTDVNNQGAFSTDFIGENYNYVNATFEERKEIDKKHSDYTKGLLYFLATDTRIPNQLKSELLQWGWAKDEFIENANFPNQLYIREARRMIGEYVMTQHDIMCETKHSDTIAFGSYGMDSHNCQRLVIKKDGMYMVKNEGNVQERIYHVYPIPYASIIPKKQQVDNLIVPFCVSSSHISFGSIRMEPVFMMLSQVAAVASYMAINNACAVQNIDRKMLSDIIRNNPYLNNNTPDILIDNTDQLINVTGNWITLQAHNNQYYTNYLYTEGEGSSIIYSAKIVKTGNYQIATFIPRKSNEIKDKLLSNDVLYQIKSISGIKEIHIDQSKFEKTWISLGDYFFNEGEKVEIKLQSSSNGLTLADAMIIRWNK